MPANSSPSLSSDITMEYLRKLLNGTAQTHWEQWQNSCLCNTIRNNGKLIVTLDGAKYEVETFDSESQIHLFPLEVSLNGKLIPLMEFQVTARALGGTSVAIRAAKPLTWGICAFSDAVKSGKIELS